MRVESVHLGGRGVKVLRWSRGMNERFIVEQATNVQVAGLAQSHILKVAKPQDGQSVVLELGDQNAKLDLSAVANEKLTFVQVGTKLIVQFDNQSTVTADPFFDSSGKPFTYLDVAFGGERSINKEQFEALVANSVSQSSLSDDDKIVPSGPHFVDPFVDPLFDGLIGPLPHGSLTLLRQDVQRDIGNLFADAASVLPSQQIFSTATALGSAPGGIVVPAPGGAATQVFEAGLGPRGGEPPGSHPGDSRFPTTTQAGSISFTSPDGVATVSLGGHALSTSPQTFADGTTGSFTAFYTFDSATHQGAIHYTYTLLDNTLGVPSTNLAVVVTDPNGDSTPANLIINIVDDTPVAKSDADLVGANQTTPETGNVLTGAGTAGGPNGPGADVQGADGGVTVVGVAAGIGAGGANPGTVG